jgi:hypothetical protein
MPRICPVSLKRRDIYGTTARQLQKIICFGNVY